MMRILTLNRDQRGAAAIEMAIALPLIVAVVCGIFEVSMLLRTSAGMQHGLGEAARRAIIYPTPDVAVVSAKVTSSMFGVEDAKSGFPVVSVVKESNTTQRWYTMSVTYERDVRFLMFPMRTFTLTHRKKVYIAQ